MKLQFLISEYLYQHKSLSLQGLGNFTLQSIYENPFENEKGGRRLPEDAIQFKADAKAGEDEGLVKFISQETGKIKPLASADLDSFLILGKQLLNISKPFVIEGIGTLQKSVSNQLEFEQGSILIQDEEDGKSNKSNKSNGESKKTKVIDENYHPSRSSEPASRKFALFSLLVVGLGIIGFVGFYIYQHTQANRPNIQNMERAPEAIQQPSDTTSSETFQSDSSLNQSLVSQASTVVNNKPEEDQFMVVLEMASRNRAFRRYAQLKELGHHIVMSTTDSVTFKLAIPVHAPIADSSRHLDSLSRYFGRRAWLDRN